MAIRTIIAIVVGAIVLLVIVWAIATALLVDDPLDDVPEATTTVGYRTYESEALAFSMLVPEDASVSTSTEDRVEVTFLGPDNEPATEITDGFTFTVFRDATTTPYQSVRTYAEVVASGTARARTEITEQLRSENVNGTTSYRYSFESELGNEVTQHVFLAETNGQDGYQVSYSIADPNNEQYQDIVSTMLESIRFR